jgi:hypothetical protein
LLPAHLLLCDGSCFTLNQQNDVGALEGFYKKMKFAIALSKKNAENKDVINFYINSGYKGFQTKYFTEHEQQEVAEEVVLEEKKIDLKKQNIDFNFSYFNFPNVFMRQRYFIKSNKFIDDKI